MDWTPILAAAFSSLQDKTALITQIPSLPPWTCWYNFNLFLYHFTPLHIFFFFWISSTMQNKFNARKKDPVKSPSLPVSWIEVSDSVSRRCQFQPDGHLSVSFCVYPHIYVLFNWVCKILCCFASWAVVVSFLNYHFFFFSLWRSCLFTVNVGNWLPHI